MNRDAYTTNEIVDLINGMETSKKKLNVMTTDMKIAFVLKQLRIRVSNKGYNYLKYAIFLCCEDEENLYLITKRLYPQVARKFGTTCSAVERGMRHSIESVYDCGDSTLIKYFGNTRRDFSNKEFISAISEVIRYSK